MWKAIFLHWTFENLPTVEWAIRQFGETFTAVSLSCCISYNESKSNVVKQGNIHSQKHFQYCENFQIRHVHFFAILFSIWQKVFWNWEAEPKLFENITTFSKSHLRLSGHIIKPFTNTLNLFWEVFSSHHHF